MAESAPIAQDIEPEEAGTKSLGERDVKNDRLTAEAAILTPSRFLINEKLGVLELMWSSDHSLTFSRSHGQFRVLMSRKLERQIGLGYLDNLDELSVYYRHDEENLGECPVVVMFPLVGEDGENLVQKIEVDSTDEAEDTLEGRTGDILNAKRRRPELNDEKAAAYATFFREKIKQPCEAVTTLLEETHSRYFKERWHPIYRRETPGDQKSFMLRALPNYDLGLSQESLATFRPFNNIQFKILQKATFDSKSRDLSRSIKLFLPHMTWNTIEDISEVINQDRLSGKRDKSLKQQLQSMGGMFSTQHFYVYFDQLEVDLIRMNTNFTYVEGRVRTEFFLQHLKFSILDNTETVPLVGPLPAPLGIVEDTSEAFYEIHQAVFNDLKDFDKNKAAGVLNITYSVLKDPLIPTMSSPRSLCIINKCKSDQSSYLAHGSVWCCGIKIDLIINRYKEVDVKLSNVAYADFKTRFMDNKRYNVAVLMDIDISTDRLVEIAVSVFEESFFKYKLTSKNCLAYMDTLARRLMHYRCDRLLRCDFGATTDRDGGFTERERNEMQSAIRHFGQVLRRISAFQKRTRLERFLHWVSRRGVDGNVIVLNPQ
ncbi:hypothetical protein BG006_001366 [Podila minutissima]|uniref:Uncharacterized protein n=1 Tax=Podila minutissima TaxID=64525 RepID=A0A9P5SE57_9FUNG|nr:hypothetical protein BG006_001366 [Podila minutissima]